MRIANQRFEDTLVRLDGLRFEHCVFVGCTLVFTAVDTVAFEGCTFENCTWKFDGPAETMLLFLTAMYHGLGEQGRRTCELVFDSIREGWAAAGRDLPAVTAAR